MRRQLRATGGITNARQGYGFGSWVKEKVRKIIPNELADIATKAAPFVAMMPGWGPAAAGVMRGVGRFDKRGSISDALKQGIGTYAGGKLFDQGMIKYGGRGVDAAGKSVGYKNLGEAFTGVKETGGKVLDKMGLGTTGTTGSGKNPFGYKDVNPVKNIWNKFQSLPAGARTAIVGVGSGAIAGIAQWFENQIPQEEGESMKEYMVRRKATVGKLMRTYMDNYFAYDPEYSALDDAGKDAFVAKYNMNKGGRVGYQTGGISMANTLAQNLAANRAQASGIGTILQQGRSRLPGAGTAAAASAAMQASSPINLGGSSGVGSIEEGRRNKKTADLLREGRAKIGGDLLGEPEETPWHLRPPAGGGWSKSVDPQWFDEDPDFVPPTTPEATPLKFNMGPGPIAPGHTDPYQLMSGLNAQEMSNLPINQQDAIYQQYENLSQSEKDSLDQQIQTSQDQELQNYLDDQAKYGSYYTPEGQTARTVDPRMGRHIYQQMLGGMKANYPEAFAKLTGNETLAELEKIMGQLEGHWSKGGRVGYAIGSPEKQLEAGAPPIIYEGNMDPRAQNQQAGLPAVPGPMRMARDGPEFDMRQRGGFQPLGRQEGKDDVPAMLAKNEFVMTADAVRAAGGGSIQKGAQRMYDTMKKLERRVS